MRAALFASVPAATLTGMPTWSWLTVLFDPLMITSVAGLSAYVRDPVAPTLTVIEVAVTATIFVSSCGVGVGFFFVFARQGSPNARVTIARTRNARYIFILPVYLTKAWWTRIFARTRFTSRQRIRSQANLRALR